MSAMGLRLIDHPLDYAIAVEGDWYHDPEVSRDSITWQYAVVPTDFVFPDIRHEIIDECYLSENDVATRSDDGIDWDEVERQAYILTGNESMLEPQTRAAKSVRPKGRITIEDKHFNKGRPIGVAGVQVSCNSFVKFDDTYTDENGQMIESPEMYYLNGMEIEIEPMTEAEAEALKENLYSITNVYTYDENLMRII
mgnify:CR=1 FL=1